MTIKLTTPDFIEKSIKTHGEKYDYSKSVYLASKKPISIICKTHGIFNQTPANHWRGSGCSQCAEEKKKTSIEHFIRVSNEKHNKKYDYSKVSIVNLNTKVIIICPVHGEFKQQAGHHMEGHCCQKCAGVKLSTNDFINKSNKIHAFKYNYSKTNYTRSKSKVVIICPVHGEFKQMPTDHLSGCGCQKCAGTKKITTKEFIEKANKIHDNKYSYKMTNIKNMNKKLTITCPTHGNFNQRAADHLNGCECPNCAHGKRGQYSLEFFNNFKDAALGSGILYLVKIKDDWCKVGITKKTTIHERFRYSKDISILREYNSTLKTVYLLEQEILQRFEKDRNIATALKNVGFSGWTECFPIQLLPELINEFDDKVLKDGK